MAGRGRTSFQKRQKEQVRAERRQQKAAKKEARKAGGGLSTTDDTVDDTLGPFEDGDAAQPDTENDNFAPPAPGTGSKE